MDDKFFLSMMAAFDNSDMTELEFTDGSARLMLRKGSVQHGVETTVSASAAKDAQDSVHLGIAAGASGAGGGASGGGEKIHSPIVATFYSSPSPDSGPFVKPGSKVKAGQTLCILEAMKMMNHLEAEFDCEIIAVHASNGDLVEYGQELFTVKK